MSLAGKLVSELELNVSADKYYNVFKDKVCHIPNISDIINKVEVHEGDWDNHGHGSIKIWNYTVDGKPEVFKEQVEFDDEKLAVTLIGLEGDVFEHYKTFKGTYQVVPKDSEHCLAILTLEYEKLKDDSPYPYKYLDLMNKLTKDIEAHHK
ncbi:MLP-like protein 328 [Cucumis melo var. makuwa]|uniref:MLP-like protein 328 n=2 Tax=Cucumis melo TaxID=3656 RepID=A0A5A7T1C3_CUCMM|nr:MLP-like protein 328 [Cucumis melo var. makuwa]TYK08661.1 MLP-like protein 328 [Cucumis melo var. makuwa]